jgi:hypothetical protein
MKVMGTKHVPVNIFPHKILGIYEADTAKTD